MSRPRRSRNAVGAVLPTRLMVFSISFVALAGLVFIATQGDDGPAKAVPAAVSSPGGPTGLPSAPTPSIPVTPTAQPPKPVNKAKTTIVVFNNTNTKGLAGETASRAQKAGWSILTTDNWHGSVDASTVYYGPRLKPAARLLADDLGISRIKPSFAPMNPKLLTVILTTDYRQ